MNYQVGDLLITTGNGKILCIITEIKDNIAYYVTSMTTPISTFRYSKESIDSLFQKVV